MEQRHGTTRVRMNPEKQERRWPEPRRSSIYHIVFSTKERAPLIYGNEIRDRLYEYLGGVIQGEKGSLLEIGGVEDHVHLLTRFGAAIAVSEMVQRIKGNSSHWLNQQSGIWFAWQNGYAAFTVSEF